MYEEKPKKYIGVKSLNVNWKSLFIKLGILLVAVFIVLWVVSLVNKDKKQVSSNLATNLQFMKTAATEYFTGSRLPSNVNGRKKITLNEMFESKLLVEFKDQDNKSCDGIGSFAEATKVNNTDYTIKVKLVCGEKSDYVIDTVSYADNGVNEPIIDNNTDNNTDNNQNNTVDNSNTNNISNKPNNSSNNTNTNSNSKPVTNITTKPNTNNNTNTCNITEYKVNSIIAAEYSRLNDEMVALRKKTNATIYLEAVNNINSNRIQLVKSGDCIIDYKILFTMKQKVNYAGLTVYEYYLNSDGTRTILTDRRSLIDASTGNNNNNNSSKPSTDIVRVTSVSLNRSSLYLDVNSSAYLYATINPSNATYKNVTWKSSNTSVASVNSSGKVTALRRGVATITATADGKSASATVYVENNVVSVSKITLNKYYLGLDINETYKLIATVTPSNATYNNVSWKSSDTSVASVNSRGEVTAHKGGTAVITASADGVSVSATVYVNSVVSVSSIRINRTSLNLEIGESYTLSASIYPSNATNKNVSWVSSDTRVATINSNGKVTAIRSGIATITATVDGISANMTVYVSGPVSVSSVVINKTSLDLYVGESYTLSATVYPSNAVNRTVYWSSSNTSVATVNSYGKVTAKKAGIALIKASADGFTTSIILTVKDNNTNNSTGSYCKVKKQIDYFMAAEEYNKYTSKTVSLRYKNTNMKDVEVYDAGYLYDGTYDYVREYFYNSSVYVASDNGISFDIPVSYQTNTLTRDNFTHNISQTYQKNGYWYIDIFYRVNNYRNVTPYYSYKARTNIYFVPVYFQIKYTDLNDCISTSQYKSLNNPRDYKKI